MRLWATLIGYATAAAAVAVVTAAAGVVLSVVRIDNVEMLYVLVVLAAAIRFGSGPAIFASVAASVAFDWFHVQPVHTFTIADPNEWLALLLFLVVSVVASQLAAAQRRRTEEAGRREREARALHKLGRTLAAHDDLDAGLGAVAEHLRAELDVESCAILLPDDTPAGRRVVPHAVAGLRLGAAAPAAEWIVPRGPSPSAATGNGAAGRRWVRIRQPARAGSRRATERVEFVPLKAGERTVGALRLASRPTRRDWTPEERRLVDAAADQLGLAIERARLRREATAAEVLRQADAARQALLASVSHDLRTPLASIKASAGSLLQRDVVWTPDERDGFAAAIEHESDRLNRLVENLLDMSRIEAGALRPEREWYPLEAVVDDVLGRLRALTAQHHVSVDVPEALPPVPLDYVQIGEALANLVENAVKYTPPGTAIRITARVAGDVVRVAVADDGPGIPAAALPHIFEKFYRVAGGDTVRTPGTGLGLAVARGLVEAHGGRIEAQSPPAGEPHGTVITFTLPLRPADRA